MDRLPYIDDSEVLAEELRELLARRRKGGSEPVAVPRQRLTREARRQIHAKTDGRCHFCGDDVAVDSFEADHVKNHKSGGACSPENFLPSCRTCNNYRWHYSAEELQWILKIGVWARKQIIEGSKLGVLMSTAFVAKEKARELRRKLPRNPKRR